MLISTVAGLVYILTNSEQCQLSRFNDASCQLPSSLGLTSLPRLHRGPFHFLTPPSQLCFPQSSPESPLRALMPFPGIHHQARLLQIFSPRFTESTLHLIPLSTVKHFSQIIFTYRSIFGQGFRQRPVVQSMTRRSLLAFSGPVGSWLFILCSLPQFFANPPSSDAWKLCFFPFGPISVLVSFARSI